uniref:Uncharacterized protein n=1 Tax=Rhizophora mucronata TaxID=61149 RepID=A0A2P2QQV7_RHIMU
MNPSSLDSQLNVVPSTPKDSQEREGFLHKCDERSSSCHKRPFSRFSSSLGNDLISPPVLKQVKNRALHEKYIDQLHCREAKRKSACVRKGYAGGKENTARDNVQELDVVRTAKNDLVSHARDAINQLQTSTLSTSSDFDNDGFSSNSDAIEDQS